jgi:hypothetical protein
MEMRRSIVCLLAIATALGGLSMAALPAGASASITVRGLAIKTTEGTGFGDNVAQFDDPSCGFTSYSASIDWGDGTITPGGTNANPSLCVGNVIGSHTYLEEGT